MKCGSMCSCLWSCESTDKNTVANKWHVTHTKICVFVSFYFDSLTYRLCGRMKRKRFGSKKYREVKNNNITRCLNLFLNWFAQHFAFVVWCRWCISTNTLARTIFYCNCFDYLSLTSYEILRNVNMQRDGMKFQRKTNEKKKLNPLD